MVDNNEEIEWQPDLVINGERKVGQTYAVLVLNTEILVPAHIVIKLWEAACMRVTVDGGTNTWLSFLRCNCENMQIKYPDLITGDFDSITDETAQYFTHSAIKFISTSDENETDFTKCLKLLKPTIDSKKVDNLIKYVVIIQENSGRLDQIMANINTLYQAATFLKGVRLYLLSSDSISWLLQKGKHTIIVPNRAVEKQHWCSLLPIGHIALVHTTGLKWDIENQYLAFGGLVSTSNTFKSNCINITTSNALLWSMGIFKLND